MTNDSAIAMDAVIENVVFTHLIINGQEVTLISEGGLNLCEIYEKQGRYYWALKLTGGVGVNVDVQKFLAQVKYSKWIDGPDADPIIDFKMTLPSIPLWMKIYSSAESGCVHRIVATLKVKDVKSSYENFTRVIRSIMPNMALKDLEKEEAILLWNKRCRPCVNRIVTWVNFKPAHFPKFSPTDLERLKDDGRWLSDSHVTLCLRHCFLDCEHRRIWGKRKIKLLDTTFWQKLTDDPSRYKDGFKRKNNIFECDFAVIPMFNENHWRLGIVENPGEFMDGKTMFHILDSLPNNSSAATEGKRLQKILLKHVQGKKYLEGRIPTNLAQVPLQGNTKDCGCFAIHFARTFFLSPDSAIAMMKTKFPSVEDRTNAWGLKNLDMTFVRREIAFLLLKYIDNGEAVVEYL